MRGLFFLLFSAVFAFAAEQQRYALKKATVTEYPHDKGISQAHRPWIVLEWTLHPSAEIINVQFYRPGTNEWTVNIKSAKGTDDASTGRWWEAGDGEYPTDVLADLLRESIKWFAARYPEARLTLFAADVRLFKEVWADFYTGVQTEMMRNDNDSLADFDLRLMSVDEGSSPREGEGIRLVTIGKTTDGTLQFSVFEVAGKRPIVQREVDFNEKELPNKAIEIARLKEKLNDLWNNAEVSPSQKRNIVADAMLITGYVPKQDRVWLAEMSSRVLEEAIRRSKLEVRFREHELKFAGTRIAGELRLINPSLFPKGWSWKASAETPGLGIPDRIPFSISLVRVDNGH